MKRTWFQRIKRNWVKKKWQLVYDPKDTVLVVSIVNDWTFNDIKHLGNCGWENRDKWYMAFEATEMEFTEIVNDLNKYGNIGLQALELDI